MPEKNTKGAVEIIEHGPATAGGDGPRLQQGGVPTQTALAKPSANPAALMALEPKVPAIMTEQISQEDWDAMDGQEKTRAAVFFLSEQAETTRGVAINFTRIKYPTSGTMVWNIEMVNGEKKYIPELEMVILYKQMTRALWMKDGAPSFNITNDPPTCSSADGKVPIEGPGKQSPTCDGCRWAQFGTGKEGSGQACKSRLNLFGLLDKEVCYGDKNNTKFPLLDDIPSVMGVPPSQLKAFGDFVVGVRKTSKSGALLSNTTVFGLKEDRNKTGTAFTALEITIGKPLGYKQMEMATRMRDQFETAFKSRGFVVDDGPSEDDQGVPF